MSLLSALSPEAVAELQSLVQAEVERALAARDRAAAPKRWATAAETASLLGISRRCLYARVRRGRVPRDSVRHSGRSLVFDLRRLDRFIEEGT
jgi:predicted DNA-binding transcriptional regulator AlpA